MAGRGEGDWIVGEVRIWWGVAWWALVWLVGSGSWVRVGPAGPCGWEVGYGLVRPVGKGRSWQGAQGSRSGMGWGRVGRAGRSVGQWFGSGGAVRQGVSVRYGRVG